MAIKRTLILLAALAACALLSGGCYTKLMTYQGEVLAGRDSTGADCGDCREVAPASDRREICVWERDMFGYPDLRCYNTNYSSSWVYFHNTPWWYRDSYGWYDSRGCPPYYYFDRISGICRYYGISGYRPGGSGGGGGGGGGAYGDPQPRRDSRVVQPPVRTSASVAEGTETSSPPSPDLPPMFSGGSSAPLSPVRAPSSPPSSSSSGQTLSKPPQETSSQKQEPPQTSQPQPQPQREPPKRDEQPSRRSSRGF